MANTEKDWLFKKGQPSANPKGRPKKLVMPKDVGDILTTHSPAIMQLACDMALGYPDKITGKPKEKPNTRILNTLLDKIKPSLKSVEYKGASQLPTMILINSDTPTRVIEGIKAQLDTEPLQTIEAPPEEK